MPETKETKTSDSNLMAALSYLWLLSVVMLVVKKDDPFVLFHAKQGLVLFIVSIALWFIPVLGWLLQLAIFVMVIIGFIKALSGEKYQLPVVGMVAEKINI